MMNPPESAIHPSSATDQELDTVLGDERERRRVLSISRLKVAVTTYLFAALVLLLGVVLLLVTHIFAELAPAIRSDLELKVRRSASELARSAEYAIVLGDDAQIQRQMAGYLQDPDVLAVAVADGDGKLLSLRGKPPLRAEELFRGPSDALRTYPDFLTAWSSTTIEGKPTGRVAMVVSTSRVHAGARLKQNILIASGIGGFLALLAILAFVRYRLVPLIRVTEQAFLRLEQTTRSALQAARLKGEFIANVSHEIRTPMNGVLGMIELLFGTNLESKQKRYATTLKSSASALMAVLDDVLDFSKIEAGKMDLRPRPVRPAALVSEVVELFQARAELAGLPLRAEMAEGVPECVSIDPDRVRQVLSNLIGNALKFTEAGEVCVRLGSSELSSSVVSLAIAVEDTGIGIEEAAMTGLFSAFSQVDGSLTRRRGGTGLGLAISRKLIDLMQGRIDVASTPGKGSVFTVHLPAPRAELPVPSVRPRAEPPGNAPVWAGTLKGRGPLLVAEDNPVNREVLAELLLELGCEADFTTDGNEALEATGRRAYSAVLMDCQMPNVDGYEATRRLRERQRSPRVPIVAVTAHAFDAEREKARDAGMDAFLSKPVSLVSLAEVLDRLLPQRRESATPPALPLDPEVRRGERTVRAFLTHAPSQIERIVNAVLTGDTTELSQAAHRLKGSCLAIGARRMSAVCAALEKGQQEPAPLCDELTHEFRELRAVLEPPEARPDAAAKGADAEEPPRVLIVDDDPAVRASIIEALEGQDFELVEASGGREAIERCEKSIPQLVLLDVRMPDMDGLATCRALRQLPHCSDLVVLMVTGLDDPESIGLAYEAGATDFIAKPIQPLILEHRVRYLLRGFRDRKASEARIAELALSDELTGLPNRAFLTKHLAYVVEQTKRRRLSSAVLCLDLDGFKQVNDSLGHAAGDALLHAVAARLRKCLRVSDCISRARATNETTNTLARLGGDEFIVVLCDVANLDDIGPVAQRIITELSKPFSISGHEVHVSVSIGIAHYPSTTDQPEDLLRNADAAMYRAKRDGGTRFQFYCEEMSQKASELIELQNDLRHALDAEEFELHFQPKLDSKTGVVLGSEALLRWRRPGHGLVPPLEFIPLAERTGLIVPIGAWVLRTACAQASAWAARGLGGCSVAVNISARQFRDRALLDTVRSALSESGLPPRCLELEITEGTLMEDVKLAESLLRELRALGVRVAIDDFGTGYSSLSYLRCLPVDTLKVDRSFVRDVTTNHDSAAITIAILAMARSLKLNVVAEGVETREQLDFLARHDCPEVQGFWFSRPLPDAEFVAWWSARHGSHGTADSLLHRPTFQP